MAFEQLRLPAHLVGDMVRPAGQLEARAEIVRLRAANYSTNAIVRSLNARQIPTPSGRGRWWPETVRRHADPEARRRWNEYMRGYRRRDR